MAKNVKTAAVKGRETKLNKKSTEDLIQIILRKDKTERNLNAQVVNLKSEVNTLQTRIGNFDSDMEGTIQSLESYKDKVKTLQEKNDNLSIEIKDARALYEEETKKSISLTNQVNIWKVVTYAITAIYVVGVIIAILVK